MAWTAAPSKLFERYGVTAKQVYGSSPLHRSQSSGLPDLPPLLSTPTAGTQSLSNLEVLSNSGGKTGCSETGDEDPDGGTPVRRVLSVGELRNIVLGSKSPKAQRSPGSDQRTSRKSKQDAVGFLHADDESPRLADKLRDTAKTSHTSALARGRGKGKKSQLRGKSKDRSGSTERTKLTRSDTLALGADTKEEDGSSSSSSESDDDSDWDRESSAPGLEDKDWGGGVAAIDPLGAFGGVRTARKKNVRQNPFKVYEDREQRMQLERAWLMASDSSNKSYMSERIRDMRLDAVYSRQTRNDMSAEELYEDVVYFGQYSKDLKILLKKKEDERKNKRRGLAHSTRIFATKEFRELKKTARDSGNLGGMSLAFEELEAQQQEKLNKTQKSEMSKSQKLRGEKNVTTADVNMLQRLQMVLQESGRMVERAHDVKV